MPIMLQDNCNRARRARRRAEHSHEALASVAGATFALEFSRIGATHWKEGNRDEGIRFSGVREDADSSAKDVKVEEQPHELLGSSVACTSRCSCRGSRARQSSRSIHASGARSCPRVPAIIGNIDSTRARRRPQLVREAETLRTDIIARERQMMTAGPDDAQPHRRRNQARARAIRDGDDARKDSIPSTRR